jgi:aquaporin Z
MKCTEEIEPRKLVSKLMAEFLGTALLSFTIAAAAGQGAALAAVAIGSTLMCVIFMGGHISGAQYNPAVTLAVFVRGRMTLVEALLYMLVQLLGALSGGGSAMIVDPGWSGGIGAPGVGSYTTLNATTGVLDSNRVGLGSALVAEIVVTFALCHTVLHVATTNAQANNSYYGLAIGFVVLSGAISVGGVSGGAFNPAVAMLTAIKGTAGDNGNLWVWVIGPLLGGALAGSLFRLTHPSECDGVEGRFLYSVRTMIAPYVMEFVGTFMLCFTVAVVNSPLAPLSIGSMLMSMIFAGGATSGAHFNPAVTVGLLGRRELARWSAGASCSKIKDHFNWRMALGYVCAQLLASCAAGLIGKVVLAHSASIGFPNPAPGVLIGSAFWAELVATFFLVSVILQVATCSKVSGNSFFGLAIGYTVGAMAVAVGGVSGGAFNPAVGLLGWVASWTSPSSPPSAMWIYFVAPPIGGALAALAFRLLSYEEFRAAEVCEIFADPEFNMYASSTKSEGGDRSRAVSLHAYHAKVATATEGSDAPIRSEAKSNKVSDAHLKDIKTSGVTSESV